MPKRRPAKIVDARAAERSAVQASLAAAEAISAAILHKKTKKIGSQDSVTNEDVVEALRAMNGVWPTQLRPNVAPDAKEPNVPGMCLGLAPDRTYAGCAIGKVSKSCPQLTALVNAWVRATLPDKEFRYGAVQVNYNYRARKHIDKNNLGPSYICSLGDHTGGALWTGDRGTLDCSKGVWKLFDGNTLHATEPYEGERFSFILFTPDAYNVLLPSIAKEAQKLGFTAASSNGLDEPYFQSFRDLGKVDEKQFDALMAARADDAPPPVGNGVVAVECNGYAAGRGSGWVSWQPPSPKAAAVVVRFPKNKTGLHVVELRALSSASSSSSSAPSKSSSITSSNSKEKDNFVGFEQVSVQRFDLYKDTDEESKRWASWVAARPLGRVVCVCITDTAMAKTRPLPPMVYEALRALGAPSSLTLIGYREPFAFVGAMGLVPESAAVALDPKKQSKTLLRVQATLGFASDSSSSKGSNANRTSAPPEPKSKKGSKGGAVEAQLHMCSWHVGEVGLLQELDATTSKTTKSNRSAAATGTSDTDKGAANSTTATASVASSTSSRKKKKPAEEKTGAPKGPAGARKRPIGSLDEDKAGAEARNKRKRL